MVQEVEDEILGWLAAGVWLDPDNEHSAHDDVAVPIGTLGVVTEVERTHMQLVWEINDDAFARYIVHCCARYHNIVSFSRFLRAFSRRCPCVDSVSSGKDSGPAGPITKRLTYLLRPHVTRPNQITYFEAPQGLETPPVTDLGPDIDSVGAVTDLTDIDNVVDVESDFAFSEAEKDRISEASEAENEIEGAPPPTGIPALNTISEADNDLGASHLPDTLSVLVDWDIEHDADGEHDSDAGDDLAGSVASLDINAEYIRRAPLRVYGRSRPWERQRRAPSSPSGSPARRSREALRRIPRVEPPKGPTKPVVKRSFYDYLFT